MVLFNYSTKEITAKIVYYGPGLCGKTTNLQFVYDNLPGTINKGKMLSLATKTDRTLFFDFLPIDLGTIRGMRTRLQLYTVPGQVFYNTTRKLVLKGADGVVFVADSQKRMIDADIESFKNLEENLAEHDMRLSEMPMIVQFNKRDLPDVASIDELNSAINKHNAPIYEAVATTGIGVHETLKAITRLVLNSLKERYADKREQRPETPQAVTAAMGRGAQATPTIRPPAPPPIALPALTAPTAQAPVPMPPRPFQTAAAAPVAHVAPIAPVASKPVEIPAPSFDDLPEFADFTEQKGQSGTTADTGKNLQDFSFDEFESGSDLDALSSPGRADAAHAPTDTFDGTDDQILELADDNDLVLETLHIDDTDEGFKLDLAEAERPLVELETPFTGSPATPAPLDVTAEVFRTELPSFGDEFATDQAIEPIPLSDEPESDLSLPSDLIEESQFGEIDYAPSDDATAIVSEDRHDDPLDLAALVDNSGREAHAVNPPGIFEEDRLNLPFEDAPSVALAIEPELITSPVSVSARRNVAGITAVPAGSQTIDLPISLEIGGKSIRFRLKVSLDLSSGTVFEAPDDTHNSGARS